MGEVVALPEEKWKQGAAICIQCLNDTQQVAPVSAPDFTECGTCGRMTMRFATQREALLIAERRALKAVRRAGKGYTATIDSGKWTTEMRGHLADSLLNAWMDDRLASINRELLDGIRP